MFQYEPRAIEKLTSAFTKGHQSRPSVLDEARELWSENNKRHTTLKKETQGDRIGRQYRHDGMFILKRFMYIPS